MNDEAVSEFYEWCNFYRRAALQDTSEKPVYLIDSEIRTHVILLRPILEKLTTVLLSKQIDCEKCTRLIGELNVISLRPIEYLMGSLEPKLDDIWNLAKQAELSPVKTPEKTHAIPDEKPLTDNDVGLLEAMLQMNLSSESIASREAILESAKWTSEGKHAFDRLKKYSYVAAKKGVGFYLTKSGIDRAKKLGERT